MKSKISKKNIVKFIIFILLIVILIIIGKYTSLFNSINIDSIKEFISSFGALAPLIFIAIYIVATIFFLPGTIFSVLGGVLFGGILGTIYVVIGATIGSVIAFYISRFLGADFVNSILKSKKLSKLDAYDEKLTKKGFIAVLILRLIPIFPFNGLNFSLGLTRVKPRSYILATLLGIIPGSFVLVNIGANATDFNNPLLYVFVVIFIILSIIPIIYKRKNKNRTQRV